ncbi:prosaposin-like [Bolinopsis microptera]|uniref:prosaposin-like n=1 Tax=Bolinopsis microptera TaxID=2820187 RepID=UPI003079C9E0
MVRGFVLLAVLGCASAFLYVNPECHEGPAYWCSSTEVAESCQATQFCQDNIWMKKEEPKNVGNFVTCKACMWVFQKVEDYTLNDANEKKLLTWVEKVCDLIPADYTATCKSMVEDYGKEAIATLAGKVGPAMVCKALGQCSAQTMLMSLPKTDTCKTCQTTMEELKQQNFELFSWWQNSCGDVTAPMDCVKYSETAKLLNKAILNESICEEMEMC